MERVVNIASNQKEAQDWDIFQQIKLKPSERQKIAKALKEKFYGKNCKDVRESRISNVQ